MMTQALSIALYLAALVVLAWATPAKGLRLFGAIFVLAYGVGSLDVLIEAVAFRLLGVTEAVRNSAIHIVEFALLTGLALAIAQKWWPGYANHGALRFTPWRVIVVVLTYTACYFVAGMLVYPYVRDYYAGSSLPTLRELLALQTLRGSIYVASSLWFLRLRPRLAPVVLGVAFALIAGLAPFAAENPLMPTNVRAAHAIEITGSNLLFGLILGWVMAPYTLASGRSAATGAQGT